MYDISAKFLLLHIENPTEKPYTVNPVTRGHLKKFPLHDRCPLVAGTFQC